MTETESAAVIEKETAEVPAIAAEPEPEPASGPAFPEETPFRPKDQSDLRTELMKKQLFWTRLGSIFLGVTMMVALLAAARLMRLVPQAEAALETAGVVMENIDQLSRQLQDADIPAILENLDRTLTQSRSSLTDVSEAVRAISAIDFAGLGEAIQDLQNVLKNPIGSLFGRG